MNKTAVSIVALVALVLGAAIGFGATSLLGPPRAGEVRNATLQVGDEAPDFRLPDHTGGYVRLSDYRGEYNVIVAFYPLAWTPV